MNPPEPNNSLSRTLAEWRVNPPVDPGFRPAVWAQVQRRARETWTGYVRAHGARWSVATVVVIAAAGWSGHHVAQARLEAGREEMVVSYLGKLDPRVLAKLRP